MATVANPRKVFNFSLQFTNVPMESMLFQEVNLPDFEIDVVEHGGTNHDIKTGGRVKVGKLVLRKLLRTVNNTESMVFWDWMQMVQSQTLGGGLTPTAYYRGVIVEEFAEDGMTPINRWEFSECWPNKINGQSQKRMASDNTIEEIELSVNMMVKKLA